MRRKAVALILLVVCIFANCPTTFAHSNEEHYKDMETVLFGYQAASIMSDAEKKKKMQYLEHATSFAIDQVNGFLGTYLEELRRFGIPNLPASITDGIESGGINFTANPQVHRRYTHLGWTKEYEKGYETANWPLRKQIIVETVKKVLNADDNTINDSFGAILYYIHLLGDMQNDSKRTERDQVIPLIEKHGLSDIFVYKADKDIFTELYHYLPLLFENKVNKTYQSYYTSMMRDIRNLYSRAKQTMKDNSEEDKKEYDNNLTPNQLDSYSKELLEILRKYMPTLLEQTIFKGVFY